MIRTRISLAIVSTVSFVSVVPIALAGEPALAAGAISLTTLGSPYVESFDTLSNTAGSTTNALTLNGWDLFETGLGTRDNEQYAVDTGGGNTGDTYSYGAAATTDRSLGGLQSGTLIPTFGAAFVNNTGATVTSLDIGYTGEQWRIGNNAGARDDRIDFQYSLDATSLTTGSWVHVDSLDFPNRIKTAPAVGALDGNAAANRATIAGSIVGLDVANGSGLWIRWQDFNASGADDGLSVDDLSVTPQSADPAPAVTATVPVDDAVGVPVGSNVTINFGEPVNVSGSWFTISCATSGSHTATVSGGPTSFVLDPDVDFAGSETCTVTVVAAGVSDQDTTDPYDTMLADYVFEFATEGPVCEQSFTPIYSIQGAGSAAAITGNLTTEGVVVGDFEGSASASGFYLQDAAGDGDATTSDGIFVFTGAANVVNVGDLVRVTGFARERFNQTAINGTNSNTTAVPATSIVNCGTGSVAPTEVSLPFADATFAERYEGMSVRFPQPLVIAEYFNYDRFGEVVLALPLEGESRPFSPTAIDEPGAAANARALANSLSRITLDDAQSAQNPQVLRHPNGSAFSLSNRFRGGDTVQNAVGVLGFDFSLYRIFPTGPADYTAVNPRPAAPEPVGGNVRVAAMNTLNFFVTLDALDDDTTDNPADNVCGGNTNLDCRGADASQPAEFTRQRDKLLTALSGLDADVIGLNELENTPGAEPMESIVNGMPGYDYVDTGTIGTDAIKVGVIYRPAVVTPKGGFQTLDSADDSRFLDTKSRPSLAQTFEVNATGARFTVVVNHLKSKGSACTDVSDPDLGDGQGNCNATREAAAQALVDWIATDPTQSGDSDFLIMGDLNSYAMEDPIDAIRAGSDDIAGTTDDYTNLIASFQGPYAYSYTFDGQAGYLDHALASPSMMSKVTGTTEWHINSDEPDILDYDTSFKPPAQEALYEVNPYRTSDHDAVVVGLNLVNTPPVAEDDTASVPKNGSVAIDALANDSDPDGQALTVVTNTQGSNGSVKYSAKNRNFRYTPDKGFAGTDTFTYTISDGYGGTATATVTVVVT